MNAKQRIKFCPSSIFKATPKISVGTIFDEGNGFRKKKENNTAMLNSKITTGLIASLLLAILTIILLSPRATWAQTIPTRTPVPAPATATPRPQATATRSGGQDPTPVPPTAVPPTSTTAPGGPSPTPIPPTAVLPTAVSATATAAPGGIVPTATAVSNPTNPTATAVSGDATVPTPTATFTTVGADAASQDGYPAPPSANPDTAAYPEPAEANESNPGQALAPANTTAVGSDAVAGETAETAVSPTPEPANTGPNLLPIVGLVLLASGVFGLIFWRRRHNEES